MEYISKALSAGDNNFKNYGLKESDNKYRRDISKDLISTYQAYVITFL